MVFPLTIFVFISFLFILGKRKKKKKNFFPHINIFNFGLNNLYWGTLHKNVPWLYSFSLQGSVSPLFVFSYFKKMLYSQRQMNEQSFEQR